MNTPRADAPRKAMLGVFLAGCIAAPLTGTDFAGAAAADGAVPDNQLREHQAQVPEALYRDGQPPVLTPPNKPAAATTDDSATIDTFRAAYDARKHPRIAVYWNRELSDRISQWFEPARLQARKDFDVTYRYGNREMHHGGRTTQSAGQQYQRTDPPRAGMSERAQMAFEDGFYGPYLQAGTKLVDRAAILRLARNDMPKRLQDDTVPDIQVLETEALRDYADLLLEVLLIPDGEAATGFSFRVLVKRVLTGEIVASQMTRIEEDANEEVSKGKLVPAPGGFRREGPEDRKVDVGELGRRLALDTMRLFSSLPGT